MISKGGGMQEFKKKKKEREHKVPVVRFTVRLNSLESR